MFSSRLTAFMFKFDHHLLAWGALAADFEAFECGSSIEPQLAPADATRRSTTSGTTPDQPRKESAQALS
ncbi:hypothetical protein WMF45_22580 [Sorangium sp. So ce448]|uniref:hypothetical protein n=1 Tax=Sorangium sp. So ce448 TaxID=3133314 RepID=UPI003F63A556